MWSDYLLLGAIGFVAQLIDGALGMAFGVISTSAMLTMGVPVAQASAMVHTAEVFTTAASAVSHIAHKNVDWKLVARLGAGGVLGAVLGAWVLSNIDAKVIQPIVAFYLMLPPLTNPEDPKVPAKELFGRKSDPAPLAARALGWYAKGCLSGAQALPVNGETWQVMRLSRNRNWGHPNLIRMVERLAEKGKKLGWNGLLVGDMSQPRGGPMLTGHTSHQVGLDADIWLTPMPDRELTRREREEMSAIQMVARDRKDVDKKVWTPKHTEIIRTAAEQPEVERVFVNAAIKKALCREAGDSRAWLHKVRPYWGHDFHFHVRIKCPPGQVDYCKPQEPIPAGDGCGKELDHWFTDGILYPKPPKEPVKPKPPITLADLPDACRAVLTAP